MKTANYKRIYWQGIFVTVFSLVLLICIDGALSGSVATEKAEVQPMTIPENVSCGKCGMYPAQYPRWHSQIIFNDDSMTPFDGCKCMFNFINAMEKHDKTHSWEDVKAILVKDFESGEWMNGPDAIYVVGSDMMGPMGKELIPFADKAAAMKFHHEHGGEMKAYDEITPEVLKSLMGGMKHGHGSGHMKM